MQASEDYLKEIENIFLMPNLIGWWYPIQNKYRQFGFNDVLSDAEMIEEYDYIAHNLNKYISSHKNQVMGSGDFEQMYDELEALHAKADEGGKERKKLVYASLRDDWLVSAMGTIEAIWNEAYRSELSEGEMMDEGILV